MDYKEMPLLKEMNIPYYVQIYDIIYQLIQENVLQEGDTLPSVRQLADDVGINMHTVNKAYSVLRQEGFVTIDRRRGAVVALDNNKAQAIAELRDSLRMLLAKGICKNITREEIHAMVDECYDDYEQ